MSFVPLWLSSLPLAQAAGLFSVPAIAAAGAALVSIPILIHLLFRLRRRKVAWAAMRFLYEAFRKQRRRLKIEQWLLLALRCLVVLLIGAALAGPLLSGCSEMITGRSGNERVVHVVIDDALSAGMIEAGDATRLDRLKAQARAVIESAAAQDEIVLWRAGEAIERISMSAGEDGEASATGDVRQRLLEKLDAMEPRFGTSAVANVLEQVAREIEETGIDSERAHIVVLSDLSRGKAWLDQPPGAVLEGLGDRAVVTIAEPATATANLQLAKLAPRRPIVVSDGVGQAVVSVSGEVKRTGGASGDVQVRMVVEVLDAAGAVVTQVSRPVNLAAGQATVPVNVDLALPSEVVRQAVGDDPASASGSGGGQGKELAVRARLESIDPSVPLDGLAADDARLSLVRVRNQLAVGVVEDVTSNVIGSAGESGRLRPGQWIEAALSPGLGVEGFEVSVVPPSSVSAQALAELDAVVVLRPDLVSAPAWGTLADYARAGGLVWVTLPADAEASLEWTRPLNQQFALEWKLGEQLVTFTAPRRLDTEQPAPPALQLLAANWPELLRPVTVTRYLPVTTEDGRVWLSLERRGAEGDADAAAPPPSSDARALMISQPIGRGAVVFLGTAIDPDWSTLAAKPLLVALTQDAMRGLLGTTARFASGISGNVLELPGADWGEQLLQAEQGVTVEDAEKLALVEQAGSRNSAEPTVKPGLYRGSGGQRLAVVNVAAEAGDTGELNEQKLAAWLEVLGPTRRLDAQGAGEVLAASNAPKNLGWVLLWVVLALVVIEMFLARRFSHAASGEGAGVAKRVMGHLRGKSIGSGAATTAGNKAA